MHGMTRTFTLKLRILIPNISPKKIVKYKTKTYKEGNLNCQNLTRDT